MQMSLSERTIPCRYSCSPGRFGGGRERSGLSWLVTSLFLWIDGSSNDAPAPERNVSGRAAIPVAVI